MKKDEVNWKGGWIRFWNLDSVVLARPFQDQVESLEQDLANIHYVYGLQLDIGWYAGGSPEGLFKIVIVDNDDWQNPLRTFTCDYSEDALQLILESVDYVQQVIEDRDRARGKIV